MAAKVQAENTKKAREHRQRLVSSFHQCISIPVPMFPSFANAGQKCVNYSMRRSPQANLSRCSILSGSESKGRPVVKTRPSCRMTSSSTGNSSPIGAAPLQRLKHGLGRLIIFICPHDFMPMGNERGGVYLGIVSLQQVSHRRHTQRDYLLISTTKLGLIALMHIRES